MPASGDQHKSAWGNPFDEARPRISEWTAQQIATLAARLDKQLGPEYISSRPGSGGSRFHYLSSDKCIGLANEVFGFNGWSSSIQNIQVDFADENPQTQRVSIGLSVILRVTLRDGTFHEDVGYGSIENAKGKAMAFEKAKKEGTTDALKRALRNFGNVLGNCVYDKDYLDHVTKIKVQPTKRFDADSLHRHPDYAPAREAPAKSEPVVANPAPKAAPAPAPAPAGAATASSSVTTGGLRPESLDSFDDFLGDFDEADFCVPDDGHPDEILLPTLPPNDAKNNTSNTAAAATTTIASNRFPRTPKPPQFQAEPHGAFGRHPAPPPNQGMPPPGPPAGGNPAEPVTFFSARSTLAEAQGQGQGQAAHPHAQQPRLLFNPKAESPSIRKTPGIDHTTSKPLSRNGQHVAPSSSQAGLAPPPQTGPGRPVRPPPGGPAGAGGGGATPLEHARRIGAPGGGMPSPLANRGQYKPPTMKRALPPEGAARAPLGDIPHANKSVGSVTGPTGDGLDAKRQKVT
ncbi:DNA repair and recombination protein rhm52 [Escovopsis weberi]|uniref:RAD52 homolog n=1 Tax=Escovopsis weberi TaxID=150374 RepID=A0A0M8N580_ESCWE|nr:DNA repair and recombination protein rhm52 [Escovopsis weberi]